MQSIFIFRSKMPKYTADDTQDCANSDAINAVRLISLTDSRKKRATRIDRITTGLSKGRAAATPRNRPVQDGEADRLDLDMWDQTKPQSLL